MLSKLVIENYALIDHLEIDFSDGFSVITGETGAGKSILLGALSLILGNRGDASVLLDTSRKCVVEGTFDIKDYPLGDLFREHELDYDDNWGHLHVHLQPGLQLTLFRASRAIP